MVAQGDDVSPRLQHPPGLGGGDAHAGGVLPVDHGEVGPGVLPQLPQAAGQDVLASLAHHVAHSQYLQQHNKAPPPSWSHFYFT